MLNEIDPTRGDHRLTDPEVFRPVPPSRESPHDELWMLRGSDSTRPQKDMAYNSPDPHRTIVDYGISLLTEPVQLLLLDS